MTNMVLDGEKSRTFDCYTCDYNLQLARNCQDQYQKVIIQLNKEVYRECPKGIILNKREEKFLVDLYFDCKNRNIYPYPGSEVNQTAYCKDLFDTIDVIVNKYQERIANEQKSKNKQPETKKKK